MTPAYLDIFERTTMAAGWATDQWAVVLIRCLIGPAQHDVDMLLGVTN